MIGRSEKAIRKQPCPAVWSTEQTGSSAKFWFKKSKGKEEKPVLMNMTRNQGLCYKAVINKRSICEFLTFIF